LDAGEMNVIVTFLITAEQMREHDTEFSVDWFDQLIGYSPVSRDEIAKDETEDMPKTSTKR